MCILYLQKNYEQSETGVDFVSNYKKIRATKILINAEIHIKFLLQTVNTKIYSAQVLRMRPIV